MPKIRSKYRRIIFYLFLLLFLILFLKVSINKFFLSLPYFKIEEINFENKKLSLNYLKGSSIFNIDLKKISKELAFKYPEFKEIVLNFQMPAKLNVEIKERKPVAKLILSRKFLLDEEAVLFLEDLNSDLDLPLIIGLENKIIKPQLYKKYEIPELLLSLDLIKICPYKIKKIEAKKKEDLTFFLEEGIKIKIGHKDYPERLERLSLLLEKIGEIKNLDYIDLRFSDPVVRFKDE